MDVTTTLPPPLTARDIFRIMRRRALLALVTFALIFGLTLFFTSKMPKIYQTTARVFINGPATTAAPATVSDLFASNASNPLEVEIEKMSTWDFLSRVIVRNGDKGLTPEIVKSMVRVAPGPGAQILDITVKSGTPASASKLANIVADEYIALVRSEYETRVDLSEQRLRQARTTAQGDREVAQAALTRFLRQAGISDPSLIYRDEAAKTVSARTTLQDAKRNLPLMEASLRTLQAESNTVQPDIFSGYTLIQNPVIPAYKGELIALNLQRKQLLYDYAEDSPEIKELDERIKAKQEAVNAAVTQPYTKSQRSVSRNPEYSSVQGAILPLQRAIEDTKRSIAVQEKRVASLNEAQKTLTLQQNQYEALKRKRDTAQELYDQANLGIMKMAVTRGTNVPNLKVMEKARNPLFPVSPKPALNLIMAVALGLMMSAGAALLAEYSASGTMLDEAELTRGLPQVSGAPLLGVLPLSLPAPLGASNEAHGLPAPVSHRVGGLLAADVLREIGFTLAHRHVKDPVPVVLLSGTRSDESTAAIAAQLAATLVRDGVRVTLVDADRSLPRLNRVFGAPDAPGLADVLAGRKLARDIVHVGANGNLRFLAAGSPQDTAAMTEENVRGVFKQLADARDTDVVIVSGPSVWQVPLVGPLEKAAGGVVLIAPAGDGLVGTTPADSVARARRLLSNGHKAQVRGVIIGLDDAAEVPLVTAAVSAPALIDGEA